MSEVDNFALRNAHRKTWISNTDVHGPFRIKVFFLIDTTANKNIMFEQSQNNDIFFLNVSRTDVKRGRQSGLQLIVWYRFLAKYFPEAEMVVRMDDDVFFCAPQMFQRIFRIRSETIYYGYMSKARYIQDMFVVLGMELVRRISQRLYCRQGIEACIVDSGLTETGNAGHSLKKWLELYDDFTTVADNMYMFYYQRLTKHKEKLYASYKTADFCEKFLLYHKAGVAELYSMFKDNLVLPEESVGQVFTKHSAPVKAFSDQRMRALPANLPIQYPNDIIIKHHQSKIKVNCKHWAVFYSIHENKEFKNALEVAKNQLWCLAIVGHLDDQKGLEYNFTSVARNEFIYLSFHTLNLMYPDISRLILENDFNRKILGYIFAIEHGAKSIWDISEHVTPPVVFAEFEKEKEILTVCPHYTDIVINPFECFGSFIRPRGFPKSYEMPNPKPCMRKHKSRLGIIQVFDPKNVDADVLNENFKNKTTRFMFEPNSMFPLLIPNGVYAPINFHSSIWFLDAFENLYLPSTVSEEAADIWRGYLAQVLLQESGLELYYCPVYSSKESVHLPYKRPHPSGELNLKNDKFVELLEDMRIRASELDMSSTYEELYVRGYVESKDLLLQHLWQKMLTTFGVLSDEWETNSLLN